VVTAADFRSAVEVFVQRPGERGAPRPGETVLVGVSSEDAYIRLRIRRPERLLARNLVHGLIRRNKLDRLAMIVPDDSQDGGPARFRVAFADRENVGAAAGISDPWLAKLAAAAEREWSGAEPALMEISGRPWPIVLLVVSLFLDLLLGLQRMARALAGVYSWLPMLPTPIAIALHASYLVLVAATIHQLWRRTRAGYVLAVILGGVQLIRIAVFAGPGVSGLGIAEALLYPALIAVCLWLVYATRARVPASAGGSGSPDKK